MIFLKRAISPVVSTALLLVVTVVAVVGFQTWYHTYSSSLLLNVEDNNFLENIITIESISNSSIYLMSNSKQQLKYLSISDENTGNLLCEFGVDFTDLLLYYPFEEIIQNQTLDVSPSGIHATIPSEVSLKNTGGMAGNYVEFTQGTINLGDQDSLEGMSRLTLEVWANIYNTHPSDIINFIGKTSAVYALDVDRISSPGYYRFINSWNNQTGSGGAGITYTSRLNEWVHVMGVYNGTHNVLYLNGVEISSRIHGNAVGSNADSLRIGRSSFNGSLDEIKIYSRALSPDEVNQSYVRPQMYLLDKLNLLDISRGCNLEKGTSVRIFGYSDFTSFEEVELII